MQAVDQAVIAQARDWLVAGAPCWLATVVATYGSSPRPVGSVFTCNHTGQSMGSLSGGCVEDDLVEKLAAGSLASDKAEFYRYGITEEETERLGLPCGGYLDIVVEPLQSEMHRAQLDQIARRLAARLATRREVDLATGESSITDSDGGKPTRFDEARQLLVQEFGPRYRLFIIGAGMVSRYLAEMAQALDYAVTLCDPRQALLDEFAVDGVERICEMPDDAVRLRTDANTAIVALTHDPRIDDMGLMEALKAHAFYVGAMGSKRTSESRRERLLQLDITDAELARLHAPIGLPIGSKTPPEIAIAILAEITAVKKACERVAREHLERLNRAA